MYGHIVFRLIANKRGTADWMYVLRQVVEKILEVHGIMALGFGNLGKTF